MYIIALMFIVIGIVILLTIQKFIKENVLQEESKKLKFLKVISYSLIGIGLSIYTYTLTDTWLEWGIVTLLLGAGMGACSLISVSIKKLHTHKWMVPFMMIPLVGALYCVIDYYIVMLSISKDAHTLMIGIMAGFVTSVDVASKEKRQYRKIMLVEVIFLYVVLLGAEQQLGSKTKPIRIISEQLTDIAINSKEIIISEDIDSPQRGKKALFRVFIEEDTRLMEMRSYTYLEGEITLESVDEFN